MQPCAEQVHEPPCDHQTHTTAVGPSVRGPGRLGIAGQSRQLFGRDILSIGSFRLRLFRYTFWKGNDILPILALTFGLLIKTKLPPVAIFVGALALTMTFGIAPLDKLLKGFSNSGVLTIGAL